MTQINFNFKGVPDTSFFSLGNQWENKIKSIQFSLPSEIQNYNKYLVASYFDKSVTHVLPINDNKFVITSTLTSKAGNWEMYVMAREDELVLDENVDISPIENKKIWLSNAIIGTVNANFSKSSIQLPNEMDENFQILYDDLLTLKNKLSNVQDGFSPIVNVEPVENGHKVSIQDKNDTKEFVILDGVNGRDGKDGKDGANGIDGRNGIDGVTPNLTIGNVTTLSSDEEATATITGTKENPVLNLGIPKGKDGEVVTSEGTPIPTKDTYGEKLIAEYIHRGNQEIHFVEFDWETGIGTTSEPHGLKNNTDVMIVPNDWYTGNWANIKHIPFEWLSHTGKIYVIPINETQLKVVQKDQTTLFSLSNSISQLPLNATMFHFEIPTNWLIKNLNTNSLRFKIDIYGLYRAHHYRYMYFNGRLKNEPVGTDKYLTYMTEYFNAPRVQNLLPATYHGLIGTNTIEVNFTLKKAWVYKIDGYFKGQRPYAQSPYEDKVTETIRQLIPDNRDIVEITTIGNSNGYAFLANQSQIRIYAMSEEPQDE